MWDCESNKSLGPDDFNFSFIKKFWGSIKGDIMQAINSFYSTSKWPKGCNVSFIALVPKCNNPQGLYQYRPISPIGCIYKIISKSLYLRLKSVLHKVIDQTQSAFLEGRGLLDSFVVANETIDEVKREKKKCIKVKVDYEKAYDSIRWDFLFYMMERLGFCIRWINWIEECLKSSTISVLVNGNPIHEFNPTKGLRQGDPLAPFLYLITAEGLASMVRQAVKKKLFQGIKVGTKEIEVNMLQYVDDTLFLCEANTQNILGIKCILRCFELAVGLTVNFIKREIGGLKVEEGIIQRYSEILNCDVMHLPFIYLGMPISGISRRFVLWREVVDKIKKRLARWKEKYLFFAGKVCMLKSVITALPLYYMSFFKMPASVQVEIKKIQKEFL